MLHRYLSMYFAKNYSDRPASNPISHVLLILAHSLIRVCRFNNLCQCRIYIVPALSDRHSPNPWGNSFRALISF